MNLPSRNRTDMDRATADCFTIKLWGELKKSKEEN